MARETKDLKPTTKKTTKKAASSSKKAIPTKKTTSKKAESVIAAIKKVVAKKVATTEKKTAVSKNASKKTSSTTKKASVSAKKSDKPVNESAEISKKSASVKTTSTKKVVSSANKSSASSTKKAAATKKSTAKKQDATTKKATTKQAAAAKKTTTKQAAATKKTTTKQATATKKSTAKKTTSSSKKSTRKKAIKVDIKQLAEQFQSEFYELPFMYNKTVVKILAQTPKMLFIYWEISEDDRNMFQKMYGENFFNNTRPILVVYNDTMNYSFEVEIDDFANSWYLHITDANCDYHVELGRKPINHKVQNNEASYIPYYVYVTSSNEMASPNNRILFNPNIKTIRFRNVKTGEVTEKDIMQFTFITNFGIFNIKDLYTYLFPTESFEFENIVLGNTSSGALSSSGIFSSQFK